MPIEPVLPKIAMRFIEDVEELERETVELERSPLAEWQVVYTTNRSDDPKHFVSIEGSSKEQRGNFMDTFIRKEHIVTVVPPQKIIAELEEIICIPEETEQIAHAKFENGVRWHKRRTSSMRIFYSLDREKKQMVFFLHKKRDWHYKF